MTPIIKLLQDASARPWTWRDLTHFGVTGTGYAHIDAANGESIDSYPYIADAKIICALVNAADDLLRLVEAARMLHDDTMDYIRLNKLGGEDNHSLKAVREALAAVESHAEFRHE